MGKANGRTMYHLPGECLPVNADRQKKLTAAKKANSHRANEKKKPSKKETDRNWKVLRNKARDTSSIEKHLAAYPDLLSHFYDGYLGSQADMDVMYWEDFLPDLNEYDDFDDDTSEGGWDDYWMCSSCARDIHYDNLIADLENRWL